MCSFFCRGPALEPDFVKETLVWSFGLLTSGLKPVQLSSRESLHTHTIPNLPQSKQLRFRRPDAGELRRPRFRLAHRLWPERLHAGRLARRSHFPPPGGSQEARGGWHVMSKCLVFDVGFKHKTRGVRQDPPGLEVAD